MAEQLILGSSDGQHAPKRKNMDDFKLNDGDDVMSPKYMLELPRPGTAVPNQDGDLAYMVVSKYSFKKKKSDKTIHLFRIDGHESTTTLEGSSAFWLDSSTLARVTEKDGTQTLETFDISSGADLAQMSLSSANVVGTFPKGISADNFQYTQGGGLLVFSALVYPDYDLQTVARQDKAYEERGTTAYVFDDTFVRHWDTWRGPKKSRLFAVALKKGDVSWELGNEFFRPLLDTQHFTPVEPFGGIEDFSINSTHIVYTTKDPSVPESLHTRQNIYLVPIKGGEEPKHLTSGTQGATHSPALNPTGDKVVWLEMARDGYESDHSSIVIYDLQKDIRFIVARDWDRSPDGITFSHDGSSLIFTAGDLGRVKVFMVPIPPTPSSQGEELQDDPHPVALTILRAASGARLLPGGRVLFTASSLISPNNAYLLTGLDQPHSPLELQRV
ncbi:hypothetical protein FRC17_001702, partial [Serendipita sp. 399]